MSNLNDRSPSESVEQNADGRDLRITDLPAKEAADEQEDALRAGIVRGGAIPTDLITDLTVRTSLKQD